MKPHFQRPYKTLSRTTIYMLLFIGIILTAYALYMFSFFKHPSRDTLVNKGESTHVYSCEKMNDFTFSYTLSKGWSKDERVNYETDTGCIIYLYQEHTFVPSTPHISVQKVIKDVDFSPEQMKKNAHGVNYFVKEQESNKHLDNGDTTAAVYFYLTPETMVQVTIELYSETGSKLSYKLDRQLFWKSVIDSFAVK